MISIEHSWPVTAVNAQTLYTQLEESSDEKQSSAMTSRSCAPDIQGVKIYSNVEPQQGYTSLTRKGLD